MNNPLKSTNPMCLNTVHVNTSVPVKKGDVTNVGQDGNNIFVTLSTDEAVVEGGSNAQQNNTSTYNLFQDREPYQGLLERLDFYLNGGNDNRFRYDVNGKNKGLSYIRGSDLGFIGGVGAV